MDIIWNGWNNRRIYILFYTKTIWLNGDDRAFEEPALPHHPGGEGLHEHAVGNAASEGGAAGELGVDVHRVVIAGQRGELLDLVLGDEPRGRGVARSETAVLEGERRGLGNAHGGFVPHGRPSVNPVTSAARRPRSPPPRSPLYAT